MNAKAEILMVPSSYSRIAARELGLQERDLPRLLRGTGLPRSILLPGDETHITAQQQMRVLENAQHILGEPDFGLRLGRRLQPASHGPMGYMVLSSPDVITALESFADFLPVRLPFSAVTIAIESDWLQCSLELKIDANDEVRRVLQECFALMIQSVVESVLGREIVEAQITLAHKKPAYHAIYADYLHAPVQFSSPMNLFRIPTALARLSNAAGHSESYAVARDLCSTLLEQMPDPAMPTRGRVERLLLSSPMGSLNADDVAQAMFVTKRTLQRRLDQEGTSYRQITEKLFAALADRHLRESNLTVETVAILLGYNDTAAFRKAFHRWYGQSPGDYRASFRKDQ
jgi:AraC-like DNA-binding protein